MSATTPGNWQAASVLPRANGVLETLVRKLARGLFKLKMWIEDCRMRSAMGRNENLQVRTKRFALQVIEFCELLPKDETSRILGRQLLRAGTSVGANYRAACRAKSKPAFISKMGDVLEESDECGYWMELLVESGKVDPHIAATLMKEATQLVAMSVASINTAKANQSGGD